MSQLGERRGAGRGAEAAVSCRPARDGGVLTLDRLLIQSRRDASGKL